MRSLPLLALSLFALPAMASIQSQLLHCSTLNDKLDRLICYDQLAASLGQADVNTDLTAVAPTITAAPVIPPAPVAEKLATQPAPSAAAEFGLPQLAAAGQDRIELDVDSLSQDAYGNLSISFSNGQQWKQTDGRKFRLKAGERVYIEKGALGSFYLGSDNRNSTIRVKRLK